MLQVFGKRARDRGERRRSSKLSNAGKSNGQVPQALAWYGGHYRGLVAAVEARSAGRRLFGFKAPWDKGMAYEGFEGK